jgi:hypothetical protein
MARRGAPKPGEAKVQKVDVTQLAIAREVGEKARKAGSSPRKGKVKNLDGTIGKVQEAAPAVSAEQAEDMPAKKTAAQDLSEVTIPVRGDDGGNTDHLNEIGKVGDRLFNAVAQARKVAENMGLSKNLGTVPDPQSVSGTTFEELERALTNGHAHLKLAGSAEEHEFSSPNKTPSLDETGIDRGITAKFGGMGTGHLSQGDENVFPQSSVEYANMAAKHYAAGAHVLHHLTSALSNLTNGQYPVFSKEEAEKHAARVTDMASGYAWIKNKESAVRGQESSVAKSDEYSLPGARAQIDPFLNKLFPGTNTVASDREQAARDGQNRLESLVGRRGRVGAGGYTALSRMAETVALRGVPNVQVPVRVASDAPSRNLITIPSAPGIGQGGGEEVMMDASEKLQKNYERAHGAITKDDFADKILNPSKETEGHIALAKDAIDRKVEAEASLERVRKSKKLKNAQGYEYNDEDRAADIEKAKNLIDKHTQAALTHITNAVKSHNTGEQSRYDQATSPAILAPKLVAENENSFKNVQIGYGIDKTHPIIKQAREHQNNALKAMNSGDHEAALGHAQNAARTLSRFASDETDRIKNERLQQASTAIEDISPSAQGAMETAAQRLSTLFNRRTR